jgi:hypothetical protein
MDESIEVLGLPIRIENALKQGGVTTLSSLSKLDLREIVRIRNIGPTSIKFVVSYIRAFLNTSDPQTSFYLNERDIDQAAIEKLGVYVNLKHKTSLEKSPSTAVSTIPLDLVSSTHVLFAALQEMKLTDKERIIMRDRLRFFTKNQLPEAKTLEEISNYSTFRVTRERVRQIEKRLIGKVIRFFRYNTWENRTDFNFVIDRLRHSVIKAKALRWPTDFITLLYQEKFPLSELSPYFFQFLIEKTVVGKNGVELINNENHKYLIAIMFKNKKHLINAVVDMELFLRDQLKPTVDKTDIETKLNKNLKGINPEDFFTIHKLISMLAGYDYENGVYIKKTFTLIDHIYNVLKEENKPLHFKEIAKRVEYLTDKNYSVYSIANASQFSDLFHTLGDGRFALKEWGYKKYQRERHDGNLSIKNLLRKFLYENEPADYITIKEHILSFRHASDYSIRQSISDLGYHVGADGKYYKEGKRLSVSGMVWKYVYEMGPVTFDQIELYINSKIPGISKKRLASAIINANCIKENDMYTAPNSPNPIRKKPSIIRDLVIKNLREEQGYSLKELYQIISTQHPTSMNTIKSYLSQLKIRQIDGKYYLPKK